MERVLVACEESQAVTCALRGRGIEAYSCDIMPCSGGHPEWHRQGDVRTLLRQKWDMIIAFPPCTHLCSSGARWFKQKREDGRQQQGIDLFMELANSRCPRIAIENPVGIMSSVWRKPDQIIQPWMFGHPVTKATCLWLKNLPALEATNDVSAKMRRMSKRKIAWIHRMPESKGRSVLRSKTFTGVAKAMASQWGDLVEMDGKN